MFDNANPSSSNIFYRSNDSSEAFLSRNIVFKDNPQDPPLSSEVQDRLQYCIDENNEDHMSRSNEQHRNFSKELPNDNIESGNSSRQSDIVRQLLPDPPLQPYSIMLPTHSCTLSDPDWSTTPDVPDEIEWFNVPPPYILYPPESLINPEGVGYFPDTSERNGTMSKNYSPGVDVATVVRSWKCSWDTYLDDEIDFGKLKYHDDLYDDGGCRDEGRGILGTSCGNKKGWTWVKIITSLVAFSLAVTFAVGLVIEENNSTTVENQEPYLSFSDYEDYSKLYTPPVPPDNLDIICSLDSVS